MMLAAEKRVDTPGIEPGTFRMLSGCDKPTTPCAPVLDSLLWVYES